MDFGSSLTLTTPPKSISFPLPLPLRRLGRAVTEADLLAAALVFCAEPEREIDDSTSSTAIVVAAGVVEGLVVVAAEGEKDGCWLATGADAEG